MKSNKFNGFLAVFKYTFMNNVSSMKYILSTAILGVLLIAGILIGIYILAKPSEDETKINEVHVFTENDLKIPSYTELAKLAGDDSLADINFVKEKGDVKDYINEHINDEKDSVLVVQKKNDDGYLLDVLYKEDGNYSEGTVSKFKDSLVVYYKMYIYMTSGLNDEELSRAILPVVATYSGIGEESNEIKTIVEIIVMFSVLLLVYMMVLIYGQQICRDVSLEKSSKLMETMLVTVNPVSLVSGKILGNIASCTMQFLIWIAAIVAGVFGGSQYFTDKFELEENIVSTIWSYLGDWFKGMGFGAGQIILAVLLILAGLVIYLMLAGLAGSMVSKPEEAANVQIIFMLPMMICYFVAIYALTSGEGQVSTFYHYIPFTSAMLTPGAIITGSVSVITGIISLGLMIITGFAEMFIAARIYQGMAFYSGKKPNFKNIVNMVLNKK